MSIEDALVPGNTYLGSYIKQLVAQATTRQQTFDLGYTIPTDCMAAVLQRRYTENAIWKLNDDIYYQLSSYEIVKPNCACAYEMVTSYKLRRVRCAQKTEIEE